MLMINASESAMESMSPEEIREIGAAVGRFDEELTAAGKNIGSIRLHPPATASTLKVRGGKVLTTDGPFAESKEQLGGIYLVEADDQSEALDIAARLPTATFSTIEVRPILGIDVRRMLQEW